ncbi:hypothetical protein IMF23_06725 [Chelatococcus daeguensis]|uniref:Lipoprotein n=1 Tax=Chelatococcus sambhunathii TaxID=363953 RepID=A0ABM9U082_9HYPH|nr:MULTISPECIES: hypothetical protein [Chelatococcus]KZE34562.1 hypothetical protein AVW15_17035 [Chelatococcus daeguensis]MBM3083124.1 hypothetical protein [Chelatococcus daeguensis]CUA85043.1 hypothetical protein Ga0061061_101667 [Chelatococcus sambhunathii]
MKWAAIALTLAASVVVAGCKTTEETSKALRGKWIGQTADAFFVENGPPLSRYELDGGGAIYTWRGGETSYVQPARVQTQGPSQPLNRSERTVTTVSNPAPGTTVTRTKTTSTSFGAMMPTAVIVESARRVDLFCEAQIATDAQGVITSVRINRDTDGAGFSFSRCAELFGDE